MQNTSPEQLEDEMAEGKSAQAKVEPDAAVELAALRRETRRWRIGISSAGILALAVYAWWFVGVHQAGLAKDGGSWGQFGDYFGGLLNPLVAFAAFYWLTRSVVIQKQELGETQTALKDAADSQERQAGHAARAVQMAAITSLNSIVASEIVRVEKAMSDLDPSEPQPIRRGYYRGRHHECFTLQKTLLDQATLAAKDSNYKLELPDAILRIQVVVEIDFQPPARPGYTAFYLRVMYQGVDLLKMNLRTDLNAVSTAIFGMPLDVEVLEFIVNDVSLGTFRVMDITFGAGYTSLMDQIMLANPYKDATASQ